MQNLKSINKAFICFIIMIFSVGFLSITLKPENAYAVEDYRTWRQNDPRWGYKYLGESSDTVRKSGCAITALSMLCVHSGAASADKINPGVVVDYFNSVNGFNKYGGINNWGTITGLVPDLKFKGSVAMKYSTQAEIANEIKTQMKNGYYVICHVKNHFVLVDSVVGNKVYMYDPACNDTDMFAKYPELNYIDGLRLFKASTSPITAPSSSVAPQTTSASGSVSSTIVKTTTSKAPVVTTSKAPVTTSKAPVTTTTPSVTKPQSYALGYYKTTDNLNHRKGPSTSYSTYGVIPKGTQIPVYEVSNGWGRIYYNKKDAWVCLEYASFISDFKFSYGGYTASSDIKLLTKQAFDSDLILTIPAGASFEVAASNNIWGFAHYNGKSGWINLLGDVSLCKNINFEKGTYKATYPINLRESSLLSGKLLGVIPQNAEFTVDEGGYNVVKVTYNGISGWAYIYSAEKIIKPVIILPTGEYFITSSGTTPLYASADKNSAVIVNAPSGYVINILEVNNDWGRISVGADTAWISMANVTYAGASPELKKGDINGDGNIDNLDLAVLNQYLDSLQYIPDGISMLRAAEIQSADINESGIVDNNDVLDYLIKICIN